MRGRKGFNNFIVEDFVKNAKVGPVDNFSGAEGMGLLFLTRLFPEFETWGLDGIGGVGVCAFQVFETWRDTPYIPRLYPEASASLGFQVSILFNSQFSCFAWT